MAYINRLSDINNKLDISIENQTETNDKLANIDDNIETLHTDLDGLTFDGSSNLNVIVKNTTPSTAVYNVITDGTNKVNITSNALNNYITNGSTTNEYSKTGLNIYQIYPKKIHYTLSGRSESAAEAVIMGGSGSSAFNFAFTFGKANPQTFSAILSGGGVPRTIRYHYIDSLGDLKTDGSITINALNTVVNLTPTNMISVNKFWINGTVQASEQVLIRVGTSNTPANTIASADYNDYYNGVITVPNGYIGYLSQFSLYTPSGMFVYVNKWDENSIRSLVYTHFNGANAAVSSGFNGSIGMILTAGESIAFAKGAGGAGIICGNFVLEPI
jgi:hypothetical protein